MVFGDVQGRYDTFRDLIQKVNREKGIAFAVNLGDLDGEGQRNGYLEYIKVSSALAPKLYNVMGNHDAVNGGWKYFEEFFGPAYYSFDYEDSHFVVLDNSFGYRFTSRQYQWLKEELKANCGRNLFVFFHRPLFDPSEIIKDHVMSPAKIASELQHLFARYKVKYVFAGHIHGFARAEREGVVYVVSAGAGAPLYLPEFAGGFYHYVRVNVEGSRVNLAVKRIYD